MFLFFLLFSTGASLPPSYENCSGLGLLHEALGSIGGFDSRSAKKCFLYYGSLFTRMVRIKDVDWNVPRDLLVAVEGAK